MARRSGEGGVALELDDLPLALELDRFRAGGGVDSQTPSSSSTSSSLTMPLSKAMARTSSMLTGAALAGTDKGEA